MAKILIHSLHSEPINSFIYNLTPEQTETVLGGNSLYGFDMMNITDNLYIGMQVTDQILYTGEYTTTIHNNRHETVDGSRSIHNTFIYRRKPSNSINIIV